MAIPINLLVATVFSWNRDVGTVVAVAVAAVALVVQWSIPESDISF